MYHHRHWETAAGLPQWHQNVWPTRSYLYMLHSPHFLDHWSSRAEAHCSDEPPHQICSYTLLFLLFLHFLYIVDPPLCTSTPTWLHAITQHLHSLHQTNLTYFMDTWFTIHMYLLLFLVSPMCLLPQSNQSWAFTPHGQVLHLGWALCSLSCFSFIFNLPVFTFHSETRATQLPIPVSPRIEIEHLHLAPSHTYLTPFRITLHCLTITLSLPYSTPGDDPLPPDRTPSEPHRIYA